MLIIGTPVPTVVTHETPPSEPILAGDSETGSIPDPSKGSIRRESRRGSRPHPAQATRSHDWLLRLCEKVVPRLQNN